MTNGDEPITMLHNASEKDVVFQGLTKREYFAAMAMQGLIAHGYNVHEYKDAANYATKAADALITSLK